MRRLIVALVALLAVTMWSQLEAQRRISPVTPADPRAKTQAPDAPRPDATEPDMSRMAHYHDDNGNIVLVDTVSGQEWVDSTRFKLPGYVYPKLHDLTIGVNVWDPVMRIFGQKYGLGSVWAGIDFYNRFMPVVEVGLSATDDTPSGLNYTYHSGVAPFFKLGVNYNFLYNSNDAYRLWASVRYGFTSFSYQIKDVVADNDYWGESVPVAFPSQRSVAGYFEIGLGLKVKIAGPVSLGWMVNYHSILHESSQPDGRPMVIPGMGKRSGSIGGSLSIMYTIPLNNKPRDIVSTSNAMDAGIGGGGGGQ